MLITKKLITLWCALLVVGCFFGYTPVVAATPVDGYIARLVDNTLYESSPSSVKQIVATYCEAVLSAPAFLQNSFVYNAKYSAFVYGLCQWQQSSSALFSDYFLSTRYATLGIRDIHKGYDTCANLSNDCNIPLVTSNFLSSLIADYVAMKQSNMYGVIWLFTGDTDMEPQINTFSQAYFGLDVCDDTHRYTSTCRTMKSYFTQAYRMLSDVKLLDSPAILSASARMIATTPHACLATGTTYDIFLCGLFSDTQTSMISFVNLTYNELFYYRLFMGYYFLMLQKNPTILAKNTYYKESSLLLQEASNQYIRSQDALSLTLRMMRDLYVAYPFHIGFLLYQEWLDGFGNILAKITVPIYTLYDTLRNVQKPQ